MYFKKSMTLCSIYLNCNMIPESSLHLNGLLSITDQKNLKTELEFKLCNCIPRELLTLRFVAIAPPKPSLSFLLLTI